MVKISKNRIYCNRVSGIYLKRLNIAQLEINSCDIYYNEGSNVYFNKIKSKDGDSVSIIKSRIGESEIGFIVKDCLSFKMVEVEIIKNKQYGIYITDSSMFKKIN